MAPATSLSSALKSSQWPHGSPAIAGPLSNMPRRAQPCLVLNFRCQGRQNTRGHFLSAHHVVLQMVPVLIHGCYQCCLLLRERKLKNSREGALWGHFLIWQTHWSMPKIGLRSRCSGFSSLCWCTCQWSWQERVVRVMCRLPLPIRLISPVSPAKKKKKASPTKLYVRYLNPCSRWTLWNLCPGCIIWKLAMATGDPPNVEVPADAHSNITVYELWATMTLIEWICVSK